MVDPTPTIPSFWDSQHLPNVQFNVGQSVKTIQTIGLKCPTAAIEGTSVTVAPDLRAFVDSVIDQYSNDELKPEQYWHRLSEALTTFTPRIQEALQTRDDLKEKLRGQTHVGAPHLKALEDMQYLEPVVPDFKITTQLSSVDDELAEIPGPQLVVPLTNERYVLNAANARWISWLSSLIGTDLSHQDGPGRGSTNEERAIDMALTCLDDWVPLQSGNWSGSKTTSDGRCAVSPEGVFTLGSWALKHPDQFIGHHTNGEVTKYYFEHYHLKICIVAGENTPIAHLMPFNIGDILLESAITTIVDGEDSVACVDLEDKLKLYRNYFDLMKGTMTAEFEKNGHMVHRSLNPDLPYVCSKTHNERTLAARSIILARVVGLHIQCDMIQYNTNAIYETIVDCFVFGLIGYLMDIKQRDNLNSRKGSLYLVVPKLHGSHEVEIMCDLFNYVEDTIGAPRHTMKIGVMDEERRTTLNLKNCVEKAKDRIIFINTGFLDRTGDQINGLSHYGVVPRKSDIKSERWFIDYEMNNVDVGLSCGFRSRAQIGKGMWAEPNAMLNMYNTKTNHVTSGATCAWVPSPTAACIHAMHYHTINVEELTMNREKECKATIEGLSQPTIVSSSQAEQWRLQMLDNLSLFSNDVKQYVKTGYQVLRSQQGTMDHEELRNDVVLIEVLNNVQCIVGYASRWIILGVGCSTINNLYGIGLMEDRATLRISSQHLANWLEHGTTTLELVLAAIMIICEDFDSKYEDLEGWKPILANGGSPALQAIVHLCLHGQSMPNGYTEPTLYTYRRMQKIGGGKLIL